MKRCSGRKWRARIVGLLVPLLVIQCGKGKKTVEGLLQVPPPYGLEQLDLSVQEQYRALKARVDKQMAQSEPNTQAMGEAFGEWGMWHQTYRYPEVALICYENAATLLPRDYRWPFYMAQIHRLWGRIEEAREAFQAALRLNPDYQATMVWLAELEMGDNRDEVAALLLDRALSLSPNSVRALLLKGRIFLNAERLDEALALLERAHRLQPEATKVRYALGVAYKKLGRMEEASSMLESAMVGIDLEVEPSLHDPLMHQLGEMRVSGRHFAEMGQSALRQGETKLAVEAFRKAVAAAPDKPGLRLQLGEALLADRQAEASIALLEETVRLFPDHAPSMNKLGIIFAMLGRLGQAEPQFEEAIRLNPNYQEAHFNLAQLRQRTNRCPEALPHFRRAIELEPSNSRQRLQRAWCVMTVEGREAVVSVLERDLIAIPEDPDLSLYLSRLLATAPSPGRGDTERAIVLAGRGFAANPSLAWAETVGLALASASNFDKAIYWQEAALAAVLGTGQENRFPWVRHRLELYRKGKMPVEPWAPQEVPVHNLRVAPPAEASAEINPVE